MRAIILHLVLFTIMIFPQSTMKIWSGGTVIQTIPLSNEVKITFGSGVYTGIVAYYPFNGNALDESGNGNNGTVTGATLTTDRFGFTDKAYSFNGSTNEIVISVGQLLKSTTTSDHSFSIWVKLNSLPTSSKSVLDCGGPTDQRGCRFDATGKPQFKWVSSTTAQYSTSPEVITTGQWHHLVGVFEGNVGKIYVDNVLKATSAVLAGTLPTVSQMKIGNISSGGTGGWWFNGSIDDIRIYNRAITPAEVQSLFSEGGWTGK